MKSYFIVLAWVITLIAGCGGGGSNGTGDPLSQTQSLSIQESQRYFPFNDGNLWVSKESQSINGIVTGGNTWVTRSAGTKLFGTVVTSVISETNVADGTVSESCLLNNDAGITNYGNNSPKDNLTAALNPYPYQLANFPLQVGVPFRQIIKTGIDYGNDIDGDGKNESVDVSSNSVVSGFETVTTAAGTFQNCLRIDTTAIITMTLSANKAKITVKAVDTDWYAQDIGPVKLTSLVTGNGQSSQTYEEVTGYMVNGRSNGLSLKVNSSSITVQSGAKTPLSVSLVDSTNLPLIAVPAVWTSSNNAIATVDTNGMATSVAPGSTTLTPTVGSITGPSITFNVQINFNNPIKYSSPVSSFQQIGDTAIGDLHGNGRNDVAVLASSNIHVYEQNVSGSLNPAQVFTTYFVLSGIAIKDVNNDGFADLIVSGANGLGGSVLVFRQDPITHKLGSPQEYVIPNTNVGPLAVADLNGDGLQDVVVASLGKYGTNGRISFLFQGTDGTLQPEVPYTTVPVYLSSEIHVADMNGDGRNDVVVQSGPQQLAVIKQVSPGVFSAIPDMYTVKTNGSYAFYSFTLGDLNGDGRTDIVVPDSTGNLNMFLQNTDGTFSRSIMENLTADEIKIYDINGDGRNDIILMRRGYNISILNQLADHTFLNYQELSSISRSADGSQSMSVGDITGDGLPDIVYSSSFVGIIIVSRK